MPAMTHAALSRDEKPGLQLSELLPFALMLALFRCFFGEKLQWARRQRRSRPMPKNWRQHYDQLRLAEWSVAELTRTGLAQLLSGKPLDLEGIETTDPPRTGSAPCRPRPSRCTAASKRSWPLTLIPRAVSAASLAAPPAGPQQ
jgi:hypothetical protein